MTIRRYELRSMMTCVDDWSADELDAEEAKERLHIEAISRETGAAGLTARLVGSDGRARADSGDPATQRHAQTAGRPSSCPTTGTAQTD